MTRQDAKQVWFAIASAIEMADRARTYAKMARLIRHRFDPRVHKSLGQCVRQWEGK